MAYVYTHKRHDKNELFYIGIGINHDTYERAYKKGRNSIWNKIVKKTTYEVSIIHDKISWEEAQLIEKTLIKKYGRIDLGTGILANLTDGGEGTPGRVRPVEEIEKFSGEKNGSYGKSWIKKEGEKDLFVKRTLIEQYLLDGWKKGRTISKETKEKNSNSHKGKKLSDEHKKKLGEKSRGHVKSDQERDRRTQSLKGRIPWHNVPGFKNMTEEEKRALKKLRGPRSCNI